MKIIAGTELNMLLAAKNAVKSLADIDAMDKVIKSYFSEQYEWSDDAWAYVLKKKRPTHWMSRILL